MIKLGPGLAEWQDKNMEHLRYEYDLKPSDKVLDIGSYRREFADEIIRRYGCTVECFDALDNRAAWLYNGTLSMGGEYYYTSLFDKGTKQQEFKCVDISPYLQEEIALCKINIEGGEYELLSYIIGLGLHVNVKNFQVQFHQVDGISAGSYVEIANDLTKTHTRTWGLSYVWENWERKIVWQKLHG